MSNLLKESQLVRDQDFQFRVEAAMAWAANDVINESPTSPHHAARLALADIYYSHGIDDRQKYIVAMVRRVAQNPTIRLAATSGEMLDQSAIPDSDIQYVVNSEWDRVAGVQSGQ